MGKKLIDRQSHVCDYLSAEPRIIYFKGGARRQRWGCCFLDGQEGPALGDPIYCALHDWTQPGSLSYGGGDPATEVEELIAEHVKRQAERFQTLDLSGINLRHRNGQCPFSIIKLYEIPPLETFTSVILDEGRFACPLSLDRVNAPDCDISLKKVTFSGPTEVKDVTCKSLAFSDSLFALRRLVISRLHCELLDLSGAIIGELIILDSEIGSLILDNATISLLRFDGSKTAGGPVGDGARSCFPGCGRASAIWSRGEVADALRTVEIRSWSLPTGFQLRGRVITEMLMLRDLDLGGPIDLTRGALAGGVAVRNLKTAHLSATDPEILQGWVRMFSAMKRAALAIGDREEWVNLAVREQQSRLNLRRNWFHIATFSADRILTRNGTSLERACVVLAAQLLVFTLLYAITDLLTDGYMIYNGDFARFAIGKFIFAFTQTVRPMSAFEPEIIGHPYTSINAEHPHLHVLIVFWAAVQGALCLATYASALLAFRHRVTAFE